MKREIITQALNSLDDRHITDTAAFSPGVIQSSPERIVYMKRKRIITFALAAVLMLALGISAYAGLRAPRSTGTHRMPKTAEYTSLSELPEIEKDVGYPATVPEEFSNGYVFSRLRVDGQAVYGEDSEVLEEYYAVNAVYSKAGAPDLSLHLSPVLEIEQESEAPTRLPGEQRTISGVTVDMNLDHYKAVPENYQKTEDDLAREAAGHYYISFGSDTVEEFEVAFAGFTLGGVSYTLMDMAAEEGSFDTLILMAEEIIEAAGA